MRYSLKKAHQEKSRNTFEIKVIWSSPSDKHVIFAWIIYQLASEENQF